MYLYLESPISQEMTTHNTRYDNLFKTLGSRLDDLELMRQFMDLKDSGSELIDWEVDTQDKMERENPTSSEIPTLQREIDNYQVTPSVLSLTWCSSLL